MSIDTQNGAGLADAGSPTVYRVVIKSLRPAYRRAGFAFTRGNSTLDNVTEAQLAILRGDGALTVVSATPVAAAVASGGLDVLGMDAGLNARIRAAVAGLDKANAEHYTKAGEPRVAAVSASLGETITAEQLKAALAEDVQA